MKRKSRFLFCIPLDFLTFAGTKLTSLNYGQTRNYLRDILKELKAKHYAPIYYLMGEEPYYIDAIADYIAEHVLSETEKEFNQTIVYGADVDIATIINAAKRYPMMSEHQVLL